MDLLIDTEGVPRIFFERPLKLVALIVTEPRTETIMWSIHPGIFEASPAPEGQFMALPLPKATVKVVDLIKSRMANDDGALRGLNPVAYVTYGVVPDGFIERTQAQGLQGGREYRVSVTGSDFEHASKLFSL